ncbi:hypothetical protein G6F50_017923 [Rhizopus delemar]|uniref:Uncharacterized protein n=1 Tax=Rhizopus delemar TaxID=936053 RepID=A0A9P6XP95_9FUNG|nr:hypothetical protein G6F24_015568 [Rhizopus arrhizus]KAG1529549.1 hypothetical protein G6F50_017923 [Rhizopus delemar]
MTPACTPNAPSAALSGPAGMLNATARWPVVAWAYTAEGHGAASMTAGSARRSAALKRVRGKVKRARTAARAGREDMKGFPGS